MAGREITDRSSPAEIARAAEELRRAQRELQQWIEDRRRDPSTPREVFEGVDYGPLISATDVERQSRIIAAQFDYVVYGNLSSSRNTDVISVGGNGFFVPGFGSNSNSVSTSTAPATSLSPREDAVTPFIPAEPPSPVFPAPLTQSFPNSSIADRGSPVNVPADSAQPTGRFTPDQVGVTQQGIVVPRESSETPVIKELTNVDDSGAIDGTGVDSGFADLSDSTAGTADSETVDTGRDDATPIEGTDTGAGTGLTSTPGSSGLVDVSEFARPRKAGSGSSVEENKVGIRLRQNVLHNYANWSYNIGFYMLTPDQHTSIVSNGGVKNPEKELTNLLIRTGGVGSKGVLGDKRDYYIENFRFTSIMGQNSQSSKSSNNFDISFEIVEPYGVAFLAELIQLALLQGIEDHFDIPYLLEIRFRGYDSNGNPAANIPGSGPKYIPIKIVGITFRITSSGTIYTVTAVPFAHSPLQNQHDAFIQENISIEGQTFNELIESLFGYLNNNERSIAREQSRFEDRYQFIVHDEDLKNSRVGFEHITDGNVISVERQSMGAPGSALREYIQISAGSTLKSAIQAIAGATDFGARFNTVGQPESEAGNEDRPLRLLKVIPAVTRLREYNTSTKRYARDIVYRIETQRMYGFVLPDMPGAKPTQRGWEKEYNWIFTGKNQDILDFEAEYNIQYYNIRNVFTEAKGRISGTPSAPGSTLIDDGLTRTEATDVFSPAIIPRSSPMSASVQNSYRGAAHQLASDHMDNVLNNPGADMVVVDLSIIGDPDWIPQDRSVLPLGNTSSGDTRIVGEGSLATDVHDVFVMLKFKTPRDYDPEKGLMKIDTDHTFVQGLYRVIKVDNNFFDGKFEQKLYLIRVQDQVSNDSNNLADLTSTESSTTAAIETGTAERQFGIFNANGTVSGSGQSARPGNFRPSPQVIVEDTRPVVQQLADPDGDGNADDPEAQIFLDPSVAAPRPPNTIEDLSSDPEFTFGGFGGP